MLTGLMKTLFLALGLVVLVEGVQFAVQGSDYFLYRVFAPRQEAVRRQTFEQSKSYNDGMAQELWDMERDYARADVAGKASIASIVTHRVAGYDVERLPTGLRRFVSQMHSEEIK